MAYTPMQYTKDGQVRTARNLEEDVWLRFEGWKLVGTAPPDPPTLAERVADLEETTAALPGTFLPITQKGAASGVASLDDTGKVPETQLPPGYATPADLTERVTTLEETTAALPGTYASKAEAAARAPGGVLYLPGVSGNYVSTPDAAELDITGDIDVRIHVALANWQPGGTIAFASKGDNASSNSWRFEINSTGGVIFRGFADGTAHLTATSNQTITAAPGTLLWVRATLDVNNGAGGRVYAFYTSEDGQTWTALGAPVTVAGAITLFNSTAPVTLGTFSTSGLLPMTGELREFELRNGIDGLVVAHYKSDVPVLRYRDETGKTWVVAGSSWAFLGKA